MSNNTINDYTAANSIDPVNDYFLIEQSSTYKKINRNTTLGITSQPLGLTDSQSPKNKIFDNTNSLTIKDTSLTIENSSSTTKQAQFDASGITAGVIRTFTFPDASGTLATIAGTQTLTNKTITSPTISGGSIDNATITVDSISGHTTGTVVTVANLQISNGVLNTNNSVVTANLTDGAVTPAKLVSGTGSGWTWSSWSPNLSNLTLGNGTQTAAYVQMGKTVFFQWKFVLGTTSSVGSSPTVTLPVTANARYNNAINVIGTGNFKSGSTDGLLQIQASTTSFSIIVQGAASTYVGPQAAVTATIPGTWSGAAADYMSVQGFYEAA